MEKKYNLEDYESLSYDEKINFLKSLGDLSLEDITKVKDILDESTDPVETKERTEMHRGYKVLIESKFFQYFLIGTALVWILFLFNLFTGFNVQSFLIALFS